METTSLAYETARRDPSSRPVAAYVLETDLGPRLATQGSIPEVLASASGNPLDSAEALDASVALDAGIGMMEMLPRVTAWDPIEQRSVALTSDLLAAMGESELESCGITLANGDGALSRLLGEEVVLGRRGRILLGFDTLNVWDYVEKFRGVVTQWTLTETGLVLQHLEAALAKLSAIVSLATSTRYAHPEQVGQILGYPYGDMRTGGDGGLMPAILIDTVNNVYCAADCACQSVDSVWDSSGALITSGYTINLANNYEGQGVITTITFTAAQTDSIYWRGQGVMSGGSLLTNPMDCWDHFLRTRAGWADADFDLNRWAQARADCATQGYGFACWIDQSRAVSAWLDEWSQDILADYWHDRQGHLLVELNLSRWSQEGDLAASIVAARDCVGGEAGVTMQALSAHLVPALTMYHLYSPRVGDYSSHVDATDAIASNLYPAAAAQSLSFTTVRSTAHLSAVAAVLFERFRGETPPKGALVTLTCHGIAFAHLTRGDRIGASWDAGPAWIGDQYRNRILKVLNVTVQPPGGPVTIEALDLGQRLYADVALDAAVALDSAYALGGVPDLVLRA